MTKEEFRKQLKQFFSQEGYHCRSSHFYKDISDEIGIALGIQYSSRPDYCYLEYGMYFKSINKYLPYPKFYQLNINCSRIMTCIGTDIRYDNVDEIVMDDIKRVISEKMNDLINIINLGNEGIINYFLHEWHDKSWYILGEETAAYFGLPKEAFTYHFAEE